MKYGIKIPDETVFVTLQYDGRYSPKPFGGYSWRTRDVYFAGFLLNRKKYAGLTIYDNDVIFQGFYD